MIEYMLKKIKDFNRCRKADRKGWRLFGSAILEFKRGNDKKAEFYIRNANRFYRVTRGKNPFKEKAAN